MARRITPDPLQVDPWTNPVRLKMPKLDELFMIVYDFGFNAEIGFTADIKGSALCEDEEAEERPCGDGGLNSCYLKYIYESDINVNDPSGLVGDRYYSIARLDLSDNTIKPANIDLPKVDDVDGPSFPESWSKVLDYTDRARLENEPDLYNSDDDPSFSYGEYADGLVDRDIFHIGDKIGSVTINANNSFEIWKNFVDAGDTLDLLELERPVARATQRRRICGDIYCTGTVWLWPFEEGDGFRTDEMRPRGHPKDLSLYVDGEHWSPVAISAAANRLSPGGAPYEYAVFFKNDKNPKTIQEMLDAST